MKLSETYNMYIAGAWVPSESGTTFDVFSPVTGDKIGAVPDGTREDVRSAVDAAGMAWRGWAKCGPFERAAILKNAASIVHERREELAYILTLEQGKPLYSEAHEEVNELIAYLEMTAADIVRVEGHILPSEHPNKRAFVHRVPQGVVGAISPWNWPYMMPAELIIPALGAGNAVVWACAPSTPITAVKLTECLVDAGLPKGLLNLVIGEGPIVGDEIAVNTGTHAVGFIGSARTGKQVAAQAAGKDLLLELGGNGPTIILEDADIDKAVAATLTGAFLCSGQSCSAAGLVLVHERVKQTFLEKLQSATESKIHLGDPFKKTTTMGPLQNENTAAKMDQHISDALAKGARVITGGARRSNRPTQLYYEPTILDGVTMNMRVSQEETFGPIVPVQTITSDEDAIEMTTCSGYGLSVAVFSEDLRRGLKLSEEIRTGTVVINDSTNWFEYHVPFGGGAGTSSGIGRVGGRFGLERFTTYKTVYLDTG